ncbi:MAG: hypothetical protein ACI9WC_000605 [Arenicella sp.]|jgi:hypothetical protein
MSQARRIKSKPAVKAKPEPEPEPEPRKLDLPWGLILVVVGCCIVIALLINGARTGNPKFGAGLNEIVKTLQREPDENAEIAELIERKSSKKEFDFYTLLPEIEKVMPDDLPDSEPTRAPDNLDYYLQAASFRDRADAEKLRARLILKNYKAIAQARDVTGKGIYHRVRIGPYRDKRKAKTAKNQLQRLGVHPFIFSIEKK